jgi:hypothetical protein
VQWNRAAPTAEPSTLLTFEVKLFDRVAAAVEEVGEAVPLVRHPDQRRQHVSRRRERHTLLRFVTRHHEVQPRRVDAPRLGEQARLADARVAEHQRRPNASPRAAVADEFAKQVELAPAPDEGTRCRGHQRSIRSPRTSWLLVPTPGPGQRPICPLRLSQTPTR